RHALFLRTGRTSIMTPTAVALMATVLLRIAVVAVVPVAAGSPIVAHLAETSFVVRPLAMPCIELLLLVGETAFPVIAVAHPAAIIRICHDRPLNFRSCRSRPVSRARQPGTRHRLALVAMVRGSNEEGRRKLRRSARSGGG